MGQVKRLRDKLNAYLEDHGDDDTVVTISKNGDNSPYLPLDEWYLSFWGPDDYKNYLKKKVSTDVQVESSPADCVFLLYHSDNYYRIEEGYLSNSHSEKTNGFEIVHVIETDSPTRLKNDLYSIFSDKQHLGCWFKLDLTDDEVDYIKNIKGNLPKEATGK